jgi:hypothetical protein
LWGTRTTRVSDDTANCYGDRALSPSVCGLCGFSTGYPGWHLKCERLASQAHCQSSHCVTDLGDRELGRTGAVREAAARLNLRTGAHRERKVCATNVPVTRAGRISLPR